MEKTIADAPELEAGKPNGININKLHATLCIAASAACSIGLIGWLMQLLG